MLGIIIGIAAIMTIVSTIQGTNEQIKQNLIGSGTDAVKIELYQGDMQLDFSYNTPPEQVPIITEEVKKQILDLEEVSKAALYNSRQYSQEIFYKNTAYTGALLGVDNSYLELYNYYIQYGRNFEEKDFKEFKKVAIIDVIAAKTLFEGENPIGKTMEIVSEPYIIIGVVDKALKFKPVINSFSDYNTYMEQSNGEIFIPITNWPIIYRYDEPQNIVIKAINTDNMTKAGKQTAEILTERIVNTDENNKITYKNDDLLKQAKQLQELGSSTNNQLLLIASISLVVGGIGVMNIMLVSVTERTKEIGLKKAIGAKRKRILLQFLTEASVLTSIGGILGIIVGIIMAQVVSKISMIPVSISIPATIISVIFSMIIGIIFGLIPAVKASKLNPIDALRSE
ncbi:MAG: FtsX-like permease family protein [Clostridia bacterium]|nr:FtsX-like permease family protein [Clostridia bacterium]